MDKRRGRHWLSFLAALMLATAGCDGQDTERLANVARYLGDQLDVFVGGANGQLPAWPALRPGMEQFPVDIRVAARLSWDKGLEGSQIQVSARDGVIELKGTVQDLTQRRRAVDLANSTAGVTEVVNNLEVSK
jgi:hypothetical protein